MVLGASISGLYLLIIILAAFGAVMIAVAISLFNRFVTL
jgi:hypothetical protein